MRAVLLLAAVAVPLALAATEAPTLPATLSRLTVAEGSDEIGPVTFGHADHAGRAKGCVSCHHELAKAPEAVPGACTACHPRHPEEGKPPDL
jgi:hypothetical protein